ncbi:hypothetical protein CHLRE_17g718300v5 [Chlamydomonas reinhardtii]|uniref:Uncharacterized protein n=1 Tax=Chlamydomonas reinhardtii TaxID=3055 RepID=A0A2K3CQ36_CHLRE|nr:uncharacterized protein CHLRE_17g718300v5 [Chlamydomonas reinhardtii]PNW70402.1 hypothetical protein CHLRE_17g718300v5 [Chlamydomonas reinhardtii]
MENPGPGGLGGPGPGPSQPPNGGAAGNLEAGGGAAAAGTAHQSRGAGQFDGVQQGEEWEDGKVERKQSAASPSNRVAMKGCMKEDPKDRHELDRKAVRDVVCAICGLMQPKAKECANCCVTFGRYSCLECSFYDDDLSKECFHCKDCGICRVGGRKNFFHCNTCNCCYAVSLRDSHVCIENSMHANCPVCCEFLFDSIKPINIMLCGHTIHQECLRKMAEHRTYTCPVCSKSIMKPEDMNAVWEEMDRELQATAMPAEYENVMVNILCNDCLAHSNVKFHVLGHKCDMCGSYNTRRT